VGLLGRDRQLSPRTEGDTMFDWLFKKPDVPEVEFNIGRCRLPLHTPDLWVLEQSASQLIFEVGMPPKTFGAPRLDAFTVEKMSLWDHKGGLVPVRISNKDIMVPRGRIKGTIHDVPTETLIQLDAERKNNVQFIRKRVHLTIPILTHRTRDRNGVPISFPDWRPHQTEAWMYIGVRDYWEPKITWDQTFHRNNPQFSLVPIVKDNRSWLNTYYDYHNGNRRTA
jgi:hypothetical protein